MSKNKKELIQCLGCGAIIQTSDPQKEGFIDQAVLDKKTDNFYCKRCFDLKHYNKLATVEKNNDEYLENLEDIKKAKGFIVNIVDAIDLDGSLIPGINHLFKSENILLVVNKIDLYLNSINRHKIYDYIRRHIKEMGIKVKDVFLMSSFSNDDISALVEKITLLNQDKKDVYFVGMSNVGKSSILNKIIESFTGEKNLITVSGSINTTLGNIVIPFNDCYSYIDTPGIVNLRNVVYYLNKESLDYIRPTSYIRPKTFQLNTKQTIFIAGFARIDFCDVSRSSLVTNFANQVLIHRTKLENADEFYFNHKDDLLLHPNEEERKKLGQLVKKTYTFQGEKVDICFGGLGFVTIIATGKVTIHTFEKILLVRRESMF